MDIQAAIDKNRNALLRLVGYWLIAACLLPAHRTLPKRLSAFIETVLSKAELAAHYLVVATAGRMNLRIALARRNGQIDHAAQKSATKKNILKRLRQLRRTLKNLDHYARLLAHSCVKPRPSFSAPKPAVGMQRIGASFAHMPAPKSIVMPNFHPP